LFSWSLINYQGRGSLAAYLTREVELAAFVGFSFARTSDSETFSVTVGLTPQGLARRFSSVFFFFGVHVQCLSVECWVFTGVHWCSLVFTVPSVECWHGPSCLDSWGSEAQGRHNCPSLQLPRSHPHRSYERRIHVIWEEEDTCQLCPSLQLPRSHPHRS